VAHLNLLRNNGALVIAKGRACGIIFPGRGIRVFREHLPARSVTGVSCSAYRRMDVGVPGSRGRTLFLGHCCLCEVTKIIHSMNWNSFTLLCDFGAASGVRGLERVEAKADFFPRNFEFLALAIFIAYIRRNGIAQTLPHSTV
jgi:hypothetical protein